MSSNIFLNDDNTYKKEEFSNESDPIINNTTNNFNGNIKKFDVLSWLPKDGFTAIFYGQRRSGKTVIVTEWISILSKKRHWKHAYLFCETANAQLDVYNFIPKINKYDTLDESVLQTIFDKQEKMKQDFDKGIIKKMEPVLIVGDDLMGAGTTLRYSGIMTKIFSQGRHFMIDFCLLLQGSKGASPAQRKNADAIISFRAMAFTDRKCLVDDYLSLENSRADNLKGFAVQEYIWNMAEFTVIVIDRAHSANCKNITEFTYYYKAEDKAKKFYIGTDDEWKDEEKQEETEFKTSNGITFRTHKKENNIFKNNASEDTDDITGYNIRIKYNPKNGKYVNWKSREKVQLLIDGDTELERKNMLVPKKIISDNN